MFERYTEKARRVIFFAHYEASQYGSPFMETEHFLLGILREDKSLVRHCLPPGASEAIRKKVDALRSTGEKVSTSWESISLELVKNLRRGNENRVPRRR